VFSVMHFHTTLFKNTLPPNCLGTAACLLDVYRVCDVRHVTSIDSCIVLLRCVSHQASKRSLHSHQPTRKTNYQALVWKACLLPVPDLRS